MGAMEVLSDSLAAWIMGIGILTIAGLCISVFYTLTMELLKDQCVNGTNIISLNASAGNV